VKQVVILAGGKGTRLRERLGGLPKPLIDVCGMPLLERQVLLAKRHGFSEILVLVNHAAEYIVDFCRARDNWGLAIECIDDGEPRGTAGATLAVFDKLRDEFLVMYGDTMLDVDLTRFHAFHRGREGVAATLFLHPNDHPHDSDLVEMSDEGDIVAFHPYPHDSSKYYPNLVNAALYWMKKESLEGWRGDPGMLDFGKDIFPEMLKRGFSLRGYNSPEYIKDVGTPARLDKVCADFQSGKIERARLDHTQAIVFIDRDGTINREVDHLSAPEEFELLPGVEEAIRRLNKSEYRCCVVTNQPVIARGECAVEGLRGIHNKMETLLGKQGAFLDRIYYCPHHPDRGYVGERPELKIECGCRKPNTGMVIKGLDDLNGAIDRSWLVGDTSVDVETARRAGIRSILVETGYAGLDGRQWALPDAIVPDLPSAVDFILDRYPRMLSFCANLAESIEPGAAIFIGGLSRSGKTTFANVLRDALRIRGLRAQTLSLDRWLRSQGEREAGVLGRYDMAAIEDVVDRLRSRRPLSVDLPGYHKMRKSKVESVDQLELSPGDVTVVEGTVALAVRQAAFADYRYHVEIDEAERKRRVIREYELRGMSTDDAVRLYAERQLDEYPLIQEFGRGATKLSLSEWFA